MRYGNVMKTSMYIRFISMVIAVLMTVFSTACTRKVNDPKVLIKYYQRNYPKDGNVHSTTSKKIQKVKRTFWKDDNTERPLDLSLVRTGVKETDRLQNSPKHQQPMMEETLSPPISHYAAEEEVNGQNTSSMIEDKIYNLIEDSYKRRDYNQFIKLYSLFVESFPHSSQKALLDERRQSFFYREDIKEDKFKGALLEVSYPGAKTFEELGLYFEKLKDRGIRSIQIRVVQFMGTPVFLFAVPQKGAGYYFANSNNLIVDNILEDITKMAHDNGLKVYASFPLRHHPRLNDGADFVMDESWNIFQNKTATNSKLDLLNPDSRSYLLSLVRDLVKFKIDGLVLKDDFTYAINEGFSDVARDRYLTATGLPLAFNRMFIPVQAKHSDQYEILTSPEFQDVALWRAGQITQLLWDIVEFAKSEREDFHVGIEVTPELLLEKYDPLKWYSTGLPYMKDLNVDFFVLKWRRFNSGREADPEDYAMAVNQLRKVVSSRKEIFLKIPLSQVTKNIIELNRKIDSHSEFQDEYPGIKFAVGPVDRIERLDIVN